MKSLKVNYFFSILKSVMAVLFPLLSFPYASRILGVDNLGIVSYCTSVISYFTLFAGLGVSIYATREGAKIKDDQKSLSKFSSEVFFINLISTFVVYVIFLVMLYLKTFDGYFLVMIICSLSVWFTTLGIEWLYQIEEEFSYISIRSMVFQFVSLILLFSLVRSREDYVQYAVVQVFASGGSCILNLLHSRKYVSLTQWKGMELKKHLKPIITIFGISAASSIYINLDIVMIRIIHNEHEVGLYTAAVKIVNIIKQIINSLSIVLISRLSNFANKKDKQDYYALLSRGFSINSAMVIPCAAGMFMIAKSILLVFSGKEYLDATLASRFLAINIIFAVLDGMIYYQILIPNRKDVLACIGTTAGAVMNLVLNALLIPNYGINGAAVATVLSEMTVFICFCISIRGSIKLSYLFGEIPKIVLSSIPILIICKVMYSLIVSEILAMFCSVVLSGITYLIMLKLLHGTLAEEVVNMMKKMMRRARNQG